jgi:hypothetical protein
MTGQQNRIGTSNGFAAALVLTYTKAQLKTHLPPALSLATNQRGIPAP